MEWGVRGQVGGTLRLGMGMVGWRCTQLGFCISHQSKGARGPARGWPWSQGNPYCRLPTLRVAAHMSSSAVGVVPVSRIIQGLQGSVCPQSLGQRLSPAVGTWSLGGLLLGHGDALSQVMAPSLDPRPFSLALFLGPLLCSAWPAVADLVIHGPCLLA